MQLLDSHVHFKNVKTNFNSNYFYFLNSTNENEWSVLADLYKSNKNILPFFGIHPWQIDTTSEGWDTRLEELIKSNKNYQIGETGLDIIKYKKDKQLFDIIKQVDIFKKQLLIAVKYNKIIAVHCVKAWEYLFEIFEELKLKKANCILHYFASSVQVMEKLLNYGFYISFYINIYDQRNKKTLDAFMQCPIDRLLLESDVYAGDNEQLLYDHYEKASKLKNIDKEEFIRMINKNGQLLSNGNFTG